LLIDNDQHDFFCLNFRQADQISLLAFGFIHKFHLQKVCLGKRTTAFLSFLFGHLLGWEIGDPDSEAEMRIELD
jgi:hypothetical protein